MIEIWHTRQLLELIFCRRLSEKLLLWLSYYLWRKWQKTTRELERAYREIDEKQVQEFLNRPGVREKLEEDCNTHWIIHLDNNEESVINKIMKENNETKGE